MSLENLSLSAEISGNHPDKLLAGETLEVGILSRLRLLIFLLLCSVAQGCVPETGGVRGPRDDASEEVVPKWDPHDDAAPPDAATDDMASTSEESHKPCFVADRPVTTLYPFIERAFEIGLRHVNVYRGGAGGPGVCLFDAESDGDSDLYFVNQPLGNLYLNDGASNFSPDENVPEGPEVPTGCLTFDFNNDERQDLFLLGINEAKLHRNDSADYVVRFTDVTEDTGIFSTDVRLSSTTADIDGDSDLDLAVSGYTNDPPEIIMDLPSLLFINHEGEYFTEEGRKRFRGVDGSRGLSFTNLFVDIDGDRDMDYFEFNDVGLGIPNYVFLNDGKGFFEEGAETLGLAFSNNQPPFLQDSADAMGMDVGDYDNNGLLDIIVSNYPCRSSLLFECHREDGKTTCSDVARDIGFTDLSHNNWSTFFDDFDNDGDLDVFSVSAAHHGEQSCDDAYPIFSPPQLLWNRGGRFDNHEAAGENNSLAISLRCDGETVNSDCIGARVKVRMEDGCSLEEHILRGGNFAGSQARPLHFGLGDAREAEVTVTWPDNSQEEIGVLAGGETYLITQDKD